MFDFQGRSMAGRVMVLGAAIALVSLAGCRMTDKNAAIAGNNGADPADVNQAPVDPNQPQQAYASPAPARTYAQPKTRVLGQSQANQPEQYAENYQQAAPVERAPDPQNYTPPQQYQAQDSSQVYQPGDENFDAAIDQYADQPPPPLPVYEQPPCPEPNYLWAPGYWSYAPAGYFWVPGAWAAPPYSGALWTPGYWGAYRGRYGFHRGFWGLHIGFYGAISYGFGYTGSGYHGGYWQGNNFYYNRSVNRVNETVIRNTYVRNVTINNTVINNRVSYNGGRGGIQARPAAYEVAAMHEQHTPPMAAQAQLREQSQQNRQQFYSANQGRPAQVVASRPLVADRGVVPPQRIAFQQTGRPEAPGAAQQSGRPGQGVVAGQPQQRVEAQPGRNVPPGNVGQQQVQQRSELQQRNQQAEPLRNTRQQPQRNQQQPQQEQRSEQQPSLQQQQQRSQQPQMEQRNPQHQPQQRLQEQQRTQQQQNEQQQRVQEQQRQQSQRPQEQRQQQQQQPQRVQPSPQPQVQRPQPQPQQPRVEPQRTAPPPQSQPQPRTEGRPPR